MRDTLIKDINIFDNFNSCFQNLCVFSMGCFFPHCLFGRIYERAGFGTCMTGCCKYYSVHLLIGLITGLINYYIQWNMIIKKEMIYLNNIDKCEKLVICNNTINYDEIHNNSCEISNSTEICNCLKQPIIDKCNFEEDLPNIINNMIIYITIISFISSFFIWLYSGVFLGYYRTKIAHKYNILYNSRYNCLLHFNPITNPCALCQEYNTVDRIETYLPTKPINYNKNISF